MTVLLRAVKLAVGFAAVAAIALIIAGVVVEQEFIAVEEEDLDQCETRPAGSAFGDQLLKPRPKQ